MQPTTFDYVRPASLEEAVGILAADPSARPLAGGHSLLPMMKLRMAAPTKLVDIGRLPGLTGVRREDDALVIGALTRHAEVAADPLVREACAILAETASEIGDRQVRNRGTIGGSLAHADPAADYPTTLSALGATVVATGPDGSREIGIADLLVDMFTTSLRAGELITEIRVPIVGAGTGGAYLKHRHPASSYAVVGVAALVAASGGGAGATTIAIGGASPTPAVVRLDLGGRSPDDGLSDVATAAREAVADPIGDIYASGEYRRHLAGVLAVRAVRAAAARA